jgi:hypothetical protein
MPPIRAPLPVEVVTKIPVQTGLNLANPGVSGGISRTVGAQVAQNAATRATVEIVKDVPGGLRNITPVTLGQKLASFGQGVGNVGTKIATGVGGTLSGVSIGTVGAVTAALLAIDASLFARPVGVGSDMVGGVKIGSQPKPGAPFVPPKPVARSTAPTTTQPKPIAKPQVSTSTAPRTATQPKPQAQTQTQVQPKPQAQAQAQPKPQVQSSRPIPLQPLPLSVNLPEPRASLETPVPQRSQPVSPDSPFPLNFVDLNSYGGVNLNYPIAQKLSEFDLRLEEIERKLEELQYWPQSFENTLKTAKIETIVNLPAQIDFTSQIPVNLNLSKEVPLNVDLSSQLPLNLDIVSQLPIKTDLFSELPFNVAFASQLPINVNLAKEIPINVDLRKEIPLAMDLTSQLPLALNLNSLLPLEFDLRKEVPITVDLRKEIPLNVDLSSKLPLNLDMSSLLPLSVHLRKEIPLALDLSAILQPDDAASGLKSLRECCENIQTTLKKKEEMFEGTGRFICNNESVPYLYRGAGLNGIHQLIKIVLGANEQILEKICNLEVSNVPDFPLIQGSGVYNCGTLPPISYDYSGVGLLGIQNQINQLFDLNKNILTEVCEIGSSPLPLSFPDISGEIKYFDCDGQTQTILYSGNGLQGLSKQIDAVSVVVKEGLKASCDASAIVVMPDARFEQFRPTAQLEITLGTRYPTQQGSLWHMYLPNPIPQLNWCEHFERIAVTKGNIYGRLEWASSKIATGAWFESEDEANRVLRYLATLSTAVPTLNQQGEPKVLIQKGNSTRRNIQERSLRAVRAAASEFGTDGEVASVRCWRPPPEGCLPTII